MGGVQLAELAWPEVSGEGRLLLMPLGATEQHGPHLPVGTDSDIATVLAKLAAGRLPGALVAPALAYGSSGEHQDFPGTLSIGAQATELVLTELGRSAALSFDRLLFVNAHGGNAAPLDAAVARLREEGRDVLAWTPRFHGDAHAGRTETSLMLALAPERVASRPAEAGNEEPLAQLIGRLRSDGVRAVSPSGVLGNPTEASAVEGHALLAAAVGDLCATVRDWPEEVARVKTESTPERTDK